MRILDKSSVTNEYVRSRAIYATPIAYVVAFGKYVSNLPWKIIDEVVIEAHVSIAGETLSQADSVFTIGKLQT